jgi:hypothetical protein
VSGSVALNTLGLTVGDTYGLDLFFAERHTSASNFRIDTSIVLTQPPSGETPVPATLALLGLGLTMMGYRKRKQLGAE